MPSYKIEDLMRSVDGAETVVLPSRLHKLRKEVAAVGERKYRPLSETKSLIKNGIRDAGRPLTYRECAIILDRRPTPHLRSILTKMVDDGELVMTEDMADSGVMPRYWYSLPS